MTIRVVCNSKLDMTGDEWALYQRMVQSYTTQFNRGEDMLIDLFVSDDKGIITFLRPPSKRQTSLEVFLFLVALTVQQHLRLMESQALDVVGQMKEKLLELDQLIAEGKKNLLEKKK